MGKYDGKNFIDPLLRCDGCSKIVHRDWVSQNGGCNHCGNRRIKSLHGFQDEELNDLKAGTYKLGLKEYSIDPEFFELFEAQEEI